MSHPRMRFTVRRLMLVVLIVAALLTAFEAGRRWERADRAAADFTFGVIEFKGGSLE